jgi:hypothetical protein
MTLTERHIAATARLAADYVASLLQPSAITARHVRNRNHHRDEQGHADIEIRNTLNRIASWWDTRTVTALSKSPH